MSKVYHGQFRGDYDVEPRKESETVFRIWPRVTVGLFAGLFLIGGCGGWAAYAALQGAVIASGVIKVDQNLKEVQHRDGGIIKTLAVRQGDLVQEGQVLVTLDEVQTKAELLIVRSQLAEALARRARLLAERDDLATMAVPGGVMQAGEAVATLLLEESRLFNGNKRARESQKEQLAHSIAQSGEEIKGLEARLSAKAQEVELVRKERAKFISLHEKGIIPNDRVFTFERDWTRILGEKGEIQASIARARARISELTVQKIAIDQNASTEAQRELRTVDARISELAERKVAIEDRLARSEIRAPVAGHVNELFMFTVGGVLSPAAKVATIVPTGTDLRFEVKIAIADIDQVRTGREARVRLAAFSQNNTPELKGRVTFLSPASTRDPATNLDHYIAQVELHANEAEKIASYRLVPGMPVEVFIATQERTALSYLVKPIMDQTSRAFRER
ncbi:HlyD family type I secretion periplasmic adaptor subunit [Enterovirga sp.]|jgi:HlyD family type I secretion membrane fusion protein|uniref:HlyD family type I secretion periplasmic adaptor subunit n=1 Tax=Enterovirga sp. TaxID=2026350 RepID=UPI0026275545|nr:HlyD family type I secretion periplasmic adaptor subunit [Enterovirga sp.]MDB5592282.1 Type secretion rane fusion protein HlyD [Enterovirga sp.]